MIIPSATPNLPKGPRFILVFGGNLFALNLLSGKPFFVNGPFLFLLVPVSTASNPNPPPPPSTPPMPPPKDITYIGFVFVPNVPVNVSIPPLTLPTTSPSLPLILPPNLPLKSFKMCPPMTLAINNPPAPMSPILIIVGAAKPFPSFSAFSLAPVIPPKYFFTYSPNLFMAPANKSTTGTTASKTGAKAYLNDTDSFSMDVLYLSAACTLFNSVL